MRLSVLILYFILVLASARARAFETADLKTGDVLLQSVSCYVCSLIELEEGEPYSHIGVVLKNDQGISVLQSWADVEAMPLSASLALRKPNTNTLVLRAIDPDGNEIQFDESLLQNVFVKIFQGLSYDDAFLWDNYDSKGEKLYCSEFVTKFLNLFLPVPMPTKPMHYTHDRADWISYFQGAPPDGMPGVSPGDFVKSPLFKTVGEISAN